MTGTILAIDLGKYNSVLCWSAAGARSGKFRSAKTTPGDLERELRKWPAAAPEPL